MLVNINETWKTTLVCIGTSQEPRLPRTLLRLGSKNQDPKPTFRDVSSSRIELCTRMDPGNVLDWKCTDAVKQHRAWIGN